MRGLPLLLAGILAGVILLHGAGGHRCEAAEGARGTTPLPASLDDFYPPIADRPVYLLGMLGLETSYSGIAVDLMEDDLDGARGTFEEFRRKYRETAAMIPEWREKYPEEKVIELGRALAAGDKGLAMNAFAAVGDACHRCHAAAMVPAQQRYRWGDFGRLTVPDPFRGATAGYPQFKRFLSANLAGITNNLKEGQAGNARKQFEEFRARFQALKGSCRGCHEKESRYFVDRDVQDTIEELGRTLERRTVAADAATSLVQRIGRESCSKCHLVHLPAARAATPRR
jgi:hypothetical protein